MLVSCASGLSSPLIPDYPEALTQDSIMDIQDTFPQRVWQIVASIPEGFVTTYAMSPGLPVPLGQRVRSAEF